MAFVVGIVLSLGVAMFARGIGFDRERSFYPTVLIVIASYYVLSAVMSGSTHALVTESGDDGVRGCCRDGVQVESLDPRGGVGCSRCA